MNQKVKSLIDFDEKYSYILGESLLKKVQKLI